MKLYSSQPSLMLSLANIWLLGLLSLCHAQTQTRQAPMPQTGRPPSKIALKASMLLNESAYGDAGQLVDEQDLIGDPQATGKAPITPPKTLWSGGWGSLYYPLSAYLDLGREYQLSDVVVYDGEGTGNFQVEYGSPFAWQPLFSDPLQGYLQWNHHPVNVKTRYVRFIVPDAGTRVPEIGLYGIPIGAIAPTKTIKSVTRLRPTMDQFLGTNAFIDDPVEKMAAVGFVREYHNWSWDAGDGAPDVPPYPNNQFAFAPSAAGGGGWNFDDYYTKLLKAGITVCPALQGSVSWLTPHESDKPVDKDQDPNKPASYRAHADYLFQFMARYGSTKVADAKLKLAFHQPRVSGLNLVHYVENGNEPDNNWSGRAAYSTPYELAARSSADYDGHRGALGATFGVKNADPKAQMVLSGLAGFNLDYLKAMKAWADFNRAGSFPADVLNLHHYSNARKADGNETVGISPEADHLKEQLRPFVQFRDQYLPALELWVTEFGYDTNPASVQRAPAIGETSAEEVQARWLVRSYLALAAAGVDRASQYMLRDVEPANTTKYASSGLVTQKGEWQPKTAWYYTATLKNRMRGMRFVGEVASGRPDVLIYQFKSDKGQGAYVVWCATSENKTVSYALPIPLALTVTQVALTKGQTNGVTSPLQIQQGKVTLEVTEKPVLILVDRL